MSVTRAGEYDWAYVYLLIVTNKDYYNFEADWIACAKDYLGEANYQYQRSDIIVVLRALFMTSIPTMEDMSNHPLAITNPHSLVMLFYPNEYLDMANMDVCVYLGGIDAEYVDPDGSTAAEGGLGEVDTDG